MMDSRQIKSTPHENDRLPQSCRWTRVACTFYAKLADSKHNTVLYRASPIHECEPGMNPEHHTKTSIGSLDESALRDTCASKSLFVFNNHTNEPLTLESPSFSNTFREPGGICREETCLS